MLSVIGLTPAKSTLNPRDRLTSLCPGHYEVRLRSIDGAWKIAAITLTVFYQEGNLTIPQIARARAMSPRS